MELSEFKEISIGVMLGVSLITLIALFSFLLGKSKKWHPYSRYRAEKYNPQDLTPKERAEKIHNMISKMGSANIHTSSKKNNKDNDTDDIDTNTYLYLD